MWRMSIRRVKILEEHKGVHIMLTLKEIKELVAVIDNSSLTEFAYKTEQGEVVLKKETQIVAAAPITQTMAPPTPIATISETAAPVEVEGTAIQSPMVGTFYSASNPESPAFVKVGDRVSKGQVVCIIEAMKLFNEIKSDVDGVVVEVLAESGQLVEFDQPLFKIKEN